MKFGRRGLGRVVVLALLASRSASALTPAEWAVRNQLIEDAKVAHKDGDHTKALSLAKKALALQASPSLHFFLAREEEETGAIGDAYLTAQQCRFEAEHDTTLHNRDEMLMGCRQIEDRLKDRVGHIVVNVEDRPTGLQVKLAGQELNDAMLGIPYVITPGTVVVEATAPAHAPFRLQIRVSEGKTVSVSVTLPPKTVDVARTSTCAPGQRVGPENVCVADSCQIGMLRTADGLHCCWPGQTWQPQAETCSGTARCPSGTWSEGEDCVSNLSDAAGPDLVGAVPLPAMTPTGVAAPALPPERTDRARWSRGEIAGASLVGVGIASIGVGIAFKLASLSAYDTAVGCNLICSADQISRDSDRFNSYQRTYGVATISGLILTSAGAALYLYYKYSHHGD